jgi:transposase
MNDPYQLNNIINNKDYNAVINLFRKYLSEKMNSLNDTFPASTWYLKNWINDRVIERSATL